MPRKKGKSMPANSASEELPIRGTMSHDSDDRSAPVSVVDKRRVGRENAAGTASTKPNLKPSYVEELEKRVQLAEEKLKARIAELEEETRRSRDRLLMDLEKRYEEKERALLTEVLDILDDVDRACSMTSEAPAVSEGLSLIASRIQRFLDGHGCRKAEPQGEVFDPNTMEAVTVQPGPENTVVKVLQAGYEQGETLLRPARVAVGNGGAGERRDG